MPGTTAPANPVPAMPEDPDPEEKPETSKENPIAELRRLIEGIGEEVGKLFDLALTIFAGASATAKDEKQKLAELESIIVGRCGRAAPSPANTSACHQAPAPL